MCDKKLLVLCFLWLFSFNTYTMKSENKNPIGNAAFKKALLTKKKYTQYAELLEEDAVSK